MDVVLGYSWMSLATYQNLNYISHFLFLFLWRHIGCPPSEISVMERAAAARLDTTVSSHNSSYQEFFF